MQILTTSNESSELSYFLSKELANWKLTQLTILPFLDGKCSAFIYAKQKGDFGVVVGAISEQDCGAFIVLTEQSVQDQKSSFCISEFLKCDVRYWLQSGKGRFFYGFSFRVASFHRAPRAQGGGGIGWVHFTTEGGGGFRGWQWFWNARANGFMANGHSARRIWTLLQKSYCIY